MHKKNTKVRAKRLFFSVSVAWTFGRLLWRHVDMVFIDWSLVSFIRVQASLHGWMSWIIALG
jgi:hypothetical protein